MTPATDGLITPELQDQREGPPFLATDRASLDDWLEFCRGTLPIKIAGLTAEQLCRRSVPPSSLSLLGIVRHLSKVERYWSLTIVAGVDAAGLYCETSPSGDFDDTDPEQAATDLQRYEDEVRAARERAAVVTDLDAPLPGRRGGDELNLRWVLIHLIEEYARHLGHVDLLRECVDGQTGY